MASGEVDGLSGRRMNTLAFLQKKESWPWGALSESAIPWGTGQVEIGSRHRAADADHSTTESAMDSRDVELFDQEHE